MTAVVSPPVPTSRVRPESGSALVLVLVFLSLFGLAVSALLGFADTSFRTTIAVRDQGNVVYGADGAVDGAINAIRDDLFAGRSGLPCPGFLAPSAAGTVTVTCTPQGGSGAPGGNPNNTPGQAILTGPFPSLNQPEDDSGFGGGCAAPACVILVKGDVFTNSSIETQAELRVDGNVTAHSCGNPQPVSVSVPPGVVDCASSLVQDDPGVSDSGYDALSGPATPRTPACGGDAVVALDPGLYSDASALTSLMSCGQNKFWFQPGVYYFDFANGGSHEWTINNANALAVGGTPKNDVFNADPPPALGDRCDEDAAGIQFIFGGDSRMRLLAGEIEVCAQPDATRQQIAIYGAKPVAPVTATLRPTAEVNDAAPAQQFADTANVRLIDGTTSDVTLPKTNPGSFAGLTMSGFDQVAIPAGATINTATLNVAHADPTSNDIKNPFEETATAGGGGPAGVTCGLSKDTSLHTDTCDLKALGFNQPAHFAGMTVKHFIQLKNNQGPGTEKLDGTSVVVNYTPPAGVVSGASGCRLVQPYPTSGCAVVETDGNNADLVIHGTVYAPADALEASITNESTQVFRRGVISRTLQLNPTASCDSCGTTPSIQLPGSGRANRKVILEARIDGVLKLRAKVEFDDAGGAVPGQQVKVLSWSVVR